MHGAQQGSAGSVDRQVDGSITYLDQIDVVLILKRAEQAYDIVIVQVDLDADLSLHLPPACGHQEIPEGLAPLAFLWPRIGPMDTGMNPNCRVVRESAACRTYITPSLGTIKLAGCGRHSSCSHKFSALSLSLRYNFRAIGVPDRRSVAVYNLELFPLYRRSCRSNCSTLLCDQENNITME